MNRRALLCGLATASISILALPTVVQGQTYPDILVGTDAELVAAMVPANAHHRIVLKNRISTAAAVDYEVDERLTVPDGATVEGEGTMRYDADGLPIGFVPGSETRVGPASTFKQQMGGQPEIFSLGNGSSLHRLIVVSPRPGNAVGILSSASGPVSASISECEIFGPGIATLPFNFGDVGGDHVMPAGPLSRGVFVRTRHQGACVTARIERSIVHADGSNSAVYATNLTSGARILLELTQNVLKDGLAQLDVVGGAGGSGVVDANGNNLNDGSTTTVQSRSNLYAGRGLPKDTGVVVEGGFDARGFPGVPRPGSNRNRTYFYSVGDRIENVATAITSQASMRTDMKADPSSFNHVQIELTGTAIRNAAGAPAPRVLNLCVTRAVNTLTTPAGEGNSMCVVMHNVDGSGDRVYSLRCGDAPLGPNNTIKISED